jgi:hypothetical protein
MAAEPVQLFSSPGNRYTAVEHEAAYQSWKITSGRSLRKTAEATGISLGTLATWSKDDGWQRRAQGEDDEDAKLLRGALAGVVTTEAVKSIATAAKLRDDETGKTPPKVRLDASIWLAGLAGVAPVKQVMDLTARTRPEVDPDQPRDDGHKRTPQENEELLRRMMDRDRESA